jgi:hypothetical protein
LINKFLISEKANLVSKDISAFLQELGFVSIEPSQANSSNPLWEGLRSGKKYFIKIARNETANFTALDMEYVIFCQLNPDIEIFRFESDDYLVTATEELSLVKSFSTDEVFKLIRSYESALGKISSVLPARLNFDVLLDFSRDAISYFQVTGQLGSSWINTLEKDLDILKMFFHQSDRVIVHGDVSPANILNSRGKLILIDWGDSFWAFRGFDQLYWLTFLQNSKDLNRSYLEKLDLDIDISQAILNNIILLKEFFHRNGRTGNNRIPPKLRLDNVQVI